MNNEQEIKAIFDSYTPPTTVGQLAGNFKLFAEFLEELDFDMISDAWNFEDVILSHVVNFFEMYDGLFTDEEREEFYTGEDEDEPEFPPFDEIGVVEVGEGDNRHIWVIA